MGLFSGPQKEEFTALLAKHGIDAADSFVVARRNHGLIKTIIQEILWSSLSYSMNPAGTRIIALSPLELVLINPNNKILGKLEDLDDKYIERIPRSSIENLRLERKKGGAVLSWSYQAKEEQWLISFEKMEGFAFNQEHCDKIEQLIA